MKRRRREVFEGFSMSGDPGGSGRFMRFEKRIGVLTGKMAKMKKFGGGFGGDLRCP